MLNGKIIMASVTPLDCHTLTEKMILVLLFPHSKLPSEGCILDDKVREDCEGHIFIQNRCCSVLQTY